MYKRLTEVRLKTGEMVEAGVVVGPDLAWAERLKGLLAHKGNPWDWQNAQVLEQELGLDAFFYILHREGIPFANIMTIENAGVGIFGHVWTVPEDRQKGASSSLMQVQMADFVERGGQALFLGTGFETIAYRIYEKFGFRNIEAESGYMAYYTMGQDSFEASYFGQPGESVQQNEKDENTLKICPLAWPHWPASAALFMGDFSGVVRSAPIGLMGQQSTEEYLLPMLQKEERNRQRGRAPQAYVLQNRASTAVIGLALWGWHPIWPNTCLVDIFCHPDYWDKGYDLLDALSLPKADRYLAYVDAQCTSKGDILTQAGFQQTSYLKQRVAVDCAKTAYVDVTVFEK